MVRMKHGCTAIPGESAPVISDRLRERFALLVVSDATFLYYARQWRTLRKHRTMLREMAQRYPLIVDFAEVRVVCERADEVDQLTNDLRSKLVRVWVSGIKTGSETRSSGSAPPSPSEPVSRCAHVHDDDGAYEVRCTGRVVANGYCDYHQFLVAPRIVVPR
jgi:hypothetical protein